MRDFSALDSMLIYMILNNGGTSSINPFFLNIDIVTELFVINILKSGDIALRLRYIATPRSFRAVWVSIFSQFAIWTSK